MSESFIFSLYLSSYLIFSSSALYSLFFFVVVFVLYFLLLNTLDTESAEFSLVQRTVFFYETCPKHSGVVEKREALTLHVPPGLSLIIIIIIMIIKGSLPGADYVFSLRGVKGRVAAEKSVINCFIRPLFIM